MVWSPLNPLKCCKAQNISPLLQDESSLWCLIQTSKWYHARSMYSSTRLPSRISRSWTNRYIVVVIGPIILNIWMSKPFKCWENDDVLWIGPRILANIHKDQRLWRDKANTVSPWCLAQAPKWMWQDHCVDSIIMPNHEVPWAQEFRWTYICMHHSQMHHLFKPWNMLGRNWAPFRRELKLFD